MFAIKQRADLVRDLPELRKVDKARISGNTARNNRGVEQQDPLAELLEVDARIGVHLVRQGLEKGARSQRFISGGTVVMSETSTVR